MEKSSQDHWMQWLLHRRSGGDPERLQAMLENLAVIRDQVLVLKPHGRLSIFEPINRFCYPESSHIFMGYDVTPIEALARKVSAVYERIHPVESSPMLNFDERDLLAVAERAGFAGIHLDLQIEIKQPHRIDPADTTSRPNWEAFLKSAGNPLVPTLEEAIAQALTADESEQFIAYLRPLVETTHGRVRQALAYLWAMKSE